MGLPLRIGTCAWRGILARQCGAWRLVTGLDSIMVGLANGSDQMHAPNEHFHLCVLENGINIYYKLFKKLANL